MTDDFIRAFIARDADMSFDERRRLSLQIAEEALARGEEIDRYRRRFCGYHDPLQADGGHCPLCEAEQERERLSTFLREANVAIKNLQGLLAGSRRLGASHSGTHLDQKLSPSRPTSLR